MSQSTRLKPGTDTEGEFDTSIQHAKTLDAAPTTPSSAPRTKRKWKYLQFFFSVLTCACAWAYFFVTPGAVSIPLIDGVTQMGDTPKTQEDRQILPTTVTPTHYILQLTPNFKDFKFNGVAVISLKVNAPTKEIKFNAADLEIPKENAKVVTSAGATLAVDAISFDKEREEAKLSFKDTIPQEVVALHLTFSGKHGDHLVGFYLSNYTDPNGSQKHMVVTQFEPTDARRAFPCWDEPSIKATFDITLHAPNGMTALSNMNEVEAKPHSSLPNYTSHHYATTPIMSTYLVAFAVGELEYIEKQVSMGNKQIPIRVYTTKGQKEQGAFALDCAAKFLEFYATEFKLAYPLPKMDMIAVPDFSGGAMENWGLVTFRIQALLFNEKDSTTFAKLGIAHIVAHEMAHQWFGNIVTMKWWDELWLNEGFAVWVGWYAVDRFFPQWQVWTDFVQMQVSKGIDSDALLSSHPIQVPVQRPSEIKQIFDSISYSKAASVIRMLATWLGTDNFVRSVALYLQRHQYKNAAAEDLWAAVREATGQDVRVFMDVWTRQIGFPVLHVTINTPLALAAGQPLQMLVRQERYLFGGRDNTSAKGTAAAASSPTETKFWSCPLSLAALPGAMLTTGEQLFDVPPTPDPLALLLNAGRTNFYRVHYATDLLGAFLLQMHRLTEVDRMGLIFDVFALSVSGEYSTAFALQFVRAEMQRQMSHPGALEPTWKELRRRSPSPQNAAVPSGEASNPRFSYFVLSQVNDGLKYMRDIWLSNKKVVDCVDQMFRDIYGPVVRELGWTRRPEESEQQGMLRTLGVLGAGTYGDAEVIAQARAYFAADPKLKQLDQNVRPLVYAIAVREGDTAVIRTIRDTIFNDTSIPMEHRLYAIAAIGNTRSESELKSHFDFVLERMRSQDWHLPFMAVPAEHNVFMWKYLKEHWDKLEAGLPPPMLGMFVELTNLWTDTKRAETEIFAFLKTKKTEFFNRTLAQTMEKIRVQEAWLTRDRAVVEAWMNENCQIR